MKFTPQKLIVIDVESTGKDVKRDQIIELAVKHGLDAQGETSTWRIKPSVAISPAARAIHGISAEDLVDCPRFSELAAEIREIFGKATVLVGYNIRFDLEMLQAEFKRAAKEPLDLSKALVVDALKIWRMAEPRRLENAVERFLGKKHLGAHGALADVNATAAVLLKMIEDFGLQGMSWEELDSFSNPEKRNWIGPSEHIQWDNGNLIIGFGRYRGRALSEIAASDSRYLSWIINADFPKHVREIAIAALEKAPDEFLSWIDSKYHGQQDA